MRWFVMIAVLVAARPSDACSVVRTYIAPTNVELVATTPTLVIARAVDETAPAPPTASESIIELEVESTIKGTLKKGDHVRVSGSTQHYMGGGAKDDFSKARPGAYAGSCTAWDYAIGKHYLLFLEYGAGTWYTRGLPFTRVNEEVDGTTDAWAIAVTKYAAITAMKPDDRQRAFDDLVAKGAKKGATAVDKAIAADVTAHLATPTPYKSFAELETMWKAAKPDAKRTIAIAIGASGDPTAKGFMKELVASLVNNAPLVDARAALVAIGAYYLKVTDPAELARVGELYITLGTKQKQARWDLMWLLIKRADASNADVMARALASADDEEAGRLVEWFAKFPSDAARKVVAKRVAGKFGEKYELALGLAAMGDKDVFVWAKKQLAAKPDEKRWVALYAIAASPLPDADALVPGIISREGEDLVTLIQGYAKAHHPRATQRLAEIQKKPGLSQDARTWLDRTIADRKSAE